VSCSLVLITDDFVGLVNLVELIDTLLLQGLVGDLVRMALERKLAVSGFDGCSGSIFGKA
jgi:hypothetical protein